LDISCSGKGRKSRLKDYFQDFVASYLTKLTLNSSSTEGSTIEVLAYGHYQDYYKYAFTLSNDLKSITAVKGKVWSETLSRVSVGTIVAPRYEFVRSEDVFLDLNCTTK
jgi:hypothetical protein